MYIFKTVIISVFTLTFATATVSVDTMEFGKPIKKHHFSMFALMQLLVSTRFFFAHKTILFYALTLSVATATFSVNTITFCVYINDY